MTFICSMLWICALICIILIISIEDGACVYVKWMYLISVLASELIVYCEKHMPVYLDNCVSISVPKALFPFI